MKKRIVIMVSLILLLVLILFLPIPTGKYDDGGTREYSALTYKIVVWNKYIVEVDETGKTVKQEHYQKTAVFWYPDNQKSINELWKLERAKNQ
jgi:uncharacterized ion transporter superfamily protein YfcC